MQITADDFRRHYESLSDEALLDVNRAELTELALDCLNAEIAARGLAAPADAAEAEEPTSHEVAPGEEMVPVGVFPNIEDAGLARALLKTAEIPSAIDKSAAGVSAGLTNVAGVRVMVPAAPLEDARGVLDAPEISEEELAAQAEAAASEEAAPEEAEEPRP